MRLVFGSRFRTKSQVEGHLMRGFARAYQPARKYVFTRGIIPESDLVRAVSEMSQCLRYRRRGREAATPTGNVNEMIAGSGRFDDVFTAGEARSGDRARMLEQFLLRTMCDHVSMIEYKKVRAEAKCLFHVVTHENHWTMKTSQGFAQLLLGFPAQMGIECSERFIEKQGIRLHGHAACNGHTLPLSARNLPRK